MDKILVIDDSKVQSGFLCSILADDYEISACYSAEEGMNAAMTGEYSLILLDVIMPGKDGFMFLQELKSMERTKYIPVILLTSLSDVQYEERGLILGAVDYVTKPFNRAVIKARVNTHIQLYHYQMQFKQQAMIDELTRVANRRRYEEESASRWQEAVRFGLPFSVCMFDIDKFKVYNDTFGHQAGDKALVAVAQKIASHFQRASDLFARYGGEEFVAVFLGGQGESVFEFMKTVRQSVEDLQIPHNPEVGPWVTISVGGITLNPGTEDRLETYLKLADTMLYDAKRTGRNRVVWSNQNQEQWWEKQDIS